VDKITFQERTANSQCVRIIAGATGFVGYAGQTGVIGATGLVRMGRFPLFEVMFGYA